MNPRLPDRREAGSFAAGSAPPPPQIPDHVLMRCIGRGAYGDVWLGRNVLGTWRAVKVVRRASFDNDRPYEREFEGIRKFEPISRSQEGLVDVLQVGRDDSAGCFYYVMELADDAEGKEFSDPSSVVSAMQGAPQPAEMEQSLVRHYTPRTLAEEVKRSGRIPVADCVRIGLALSLALEHLHEHGLVHRDIKPANVIFVHGTPKLADIGLVTDAGGPHSFVGTEGFIPPEGPGSRQADVFSLGKVLYEMATGKDRTEFPNPRTDLGALADREQLLELDEVIARACEADCGKRYASASAMRADLALLLGGKSLRRLRRIERRLARLTRVGAVAAMVMLLGAGAYFNQWRQSQRVRALAEESRDRLIRLQAANGVRQMDEGDFSASALWFAEALKLAEGNPDREWVHRRRLEAVLERSPRLIAVGSHRGRIRAAQFSPDGRLFATAGVDGTVRTWDASTGAATGMVLQHEKSIHDLRFSPDGRWLATADVDNITRVWNLTTGETRFAPIRHSQFVNAVRFSGDGQWLVTASEDHTARIWDAANGQPAGEEFQHDGPVNDAEFSPLGDLLVTASDDDTARIWDVQTGKPVGARLTHGHDVRSARFSPDGQFVVTASKDGAARVWDAQTGEPITGPLQHSVPLWTAEFSRDGRSVLAAGGDGDNGGTARVWDGQTGTPRTPPLRHANTIRNAIFSPDGCWIATASHDRSVSLWNASNGARVGSPLRNTHFMKWVSFSPDGKRLLAAGEDEAWRLWDVAEVLEHATPPQERLPFGMAVFSPDGRTILGISTNQAAALLDAATHRVRFTLGEHPTNITYVVFSANSQRVLTMGDDGGVHVWNTADGKRVGQPIKHGSNASLNGRAAFSADGRLLASVSFAEDDLVKVWNLEAGGACLFELKHPYSAKAAAFSPDGSALLTGGGSEISGMGGEARLWSVRTGRPLGEPMPHPGTVFTVRWSGDGSHFLTVCHDPSLLPQSARLWEMATGWMIPLPSRQIRFNVAAFSPDGRFLATGASDGEVRLWSETTGAPTTKSFGHRRACWLVEFSPDGRQLASSSLDSVVRIWDPLTGEPLGPALEHGALVGRVSFSPTGDQVLVSGGNRTTLWRWTTTSASSDHLQHLAQLAAGCRLDDTGGLEPLTTAQLSDLLNRLRSK